MNTGIGNLRENLQEIGEMTIDPSLPPMERTVTYMSQVKESNRFRVGDTVVEMGWADTEATLQSVLHDLLASNFQ